MQNSFSYLFPFFYRPKFISLLLCELHPCLNDHIYIFQIVSKLELSTSTLKSVRDRDFCSRASINNVGKKNKL